MTVRYNVMTRFKDDTQSEVNIYNPYSMDWNSFKWENGYIPHTVTRGEIEKSYFLSYNYFKTTVYEDAILLLNNIKDVFEIRAGVVVRIPDLDELKTFLYNNKK